MHKQRAVRGDAVRSSPDQKHFYIYALAEPGSREARYVGLSSAPLSERLEEHCRPDASKRSERADWIRALLAEGRRPEIHLLEEMFGWRSAALSLEHTWIVRMHRRGHRLLNRPLPKADEA